MDKYVVPIAPAAPSLASEAGSKRRAEEPAVVILSDDEDRQEDSSDADSGEGESYLPSMAKKVKPAPVKTPAKKQTIKDIEGQIAALQEQAAQSPSQTESDTTLQYIQVLPETLRLYYEHFRSPVIDS
jgi:hypothetical protein